MTARARLSSFSEVCMKRFGVGAGSRIRTDDRLITNQVLYQLSYTGKSRDERARTSKSPGPKPGAIPLRYVP
jgi:hypothetical protein